MVKRTNGLHHFLASEALGKGALAQLTVLRLDFNAIGDTGMSALASACANGALDHLTVCWRPTA